MRESIFGYRVRQGRGVRQWVLSLPFELRAAIAREIAEDDLDPEGLVLAYCQQPRQWLSIRAAESSSLSEPPRECGARAIERTRGAGDDRLVTSCARSGTPYVRSCEDDPGLRTRYARLRSRFARQHTTCREVRTPESLLRDRFALQRATVCRERAREAPLCGRVPLRPAIVRRERAREVPACALIARARPNDVLECRPSARPGEPFRRARVREARSLATVARSSTPEARHPPNGARDRGSYATERPREPRQRTTGDRASRRGARGSRRDPPSSEHEGRDR